MSKSGIVNVRMVITEEKILSNIDKIQKMINPNTKKQIIQLYDDSYFKDLIESIKAYLVEYPKKKNFPTSVYNAAYGLVETATNQFEENTKKISDLIRQREENIQKAGQLREILDLAQNKDKGWKEQIKALEGDVSEDIIEALSIIGRLRKRDTQNYLDAEKLLNARINNLEANLHIEIDMERIEDRSKALSYIGIEIADALKVIPESISDGEEIDAGEELIEEEEILVGQTEQIGQPVQMVEEQVQEIQQPVQAIEQTPQAAQQEIEEYQKETTIDAKPTLWQRIKNSKIVRAINAIMNIRIKIEMPSNALPEGRGENQ